MDMGWKCRKQPIHFHSPLCPGLLNPVSAPIWVVCFQLCHSCRHAWTRTAPQTVQAELQSWPCTASRKRERSGLQGSCTDGTIRESSYAAVISMVTLGSICVLSSQVGWQPARRPLCLCFPGIHRWNRIKLLSAGAAGSQGMGHLPDEMRTFPPGLQTAWRFICSGLDLLCLLLCKQWGAVWMKMVSPSFLLAERQSPLY